MVARLTLGRCQHRPTLVSALGPQIREPLTLGKLLNIICTWNTGKHTSHVGRWVVWHKWFFGSNVGLCFVVHLQLSFGVVSMIHIMLNDPHRSSMILNDPETKVMLPPHLGWSCSPSHHPSKECPPLHQSRNPSDQNSSCNCRCSNIGLSLNIQEYFHSSLTDTQLLTNNLFLAKPFTLSLNGE